MSIQALGWAIERASCPSASSKLVLIVLANYANERGRAWASTETICRLSGLNRDTVRRAVSALEGVLISDSGHREGLTGRITVYDLAIDTCPKPSTLDAEPAGRASGEPQEGIQGKRITMCRKAGRLNMPSSRLGNCRKLGTKPSREPLPPDDPDGSSRPPRGGRVRGSRIPEDWKPSAIADLPPLARAIVEQWPAGAYETEAEAFLNYWLGEGRAGARKLDWTRTWCNRIIQLGAKPLRDAKAGMRFDKPAALATPAAPVDHSGEDAAALQMRVTMRGLLGERAYANWLDPTIIRIDGSNITVVAASEFTRDWLEQNYADDMAIAAAAAIDRQATMTWQSDPGAFAAGAPLRVI